MAAMFAGCTDIGDTGSSRVAIVSPDFVDAPPYRLPAVVSLGGCTGTLISPSHVLAAAHCVDVEVPDLVSFRTDGASRAIGVARCFMHPRWAVSGPWSDPRYRRPEYAGMDVGDRCGVLDHPPGFGGGVDDFAVLQLNRPVPHAVPVAIGVGAGDLFVAPLPVAVTSSAPFSAVAVGFASGTRDVRAFTAPGESSGTVVLGGILQPGDSGGPLLSDVGGGRYEVVGVASNTSTWAAVTTAALSWIGSRVDTDGDDRIDSACKLRPECAWRDGRGAHRDARADNDRDGDGYLDVDDSCPGTYNPCQEEADLDGDGVPDDCDGCPRDNTLSSERGVLPDRDSDLTPDACDCLPDQYSPLEWSLPSALFGGDEDCDLALGVASTSLVCDNCPAAWNPFQADRDRDGLGDVCDRCADDPDVMSGRVPIDRDRDTVPDACDNCRDVANALQADCNLDAERALWEIACPPGPDGTRACTFYEFIGFEGGDVCDATPCGETRIATETVGARTDEELVQNAVRVDARAAVPRDARTGFRFCRCSVATHDSPEARRQCQAEEHLPLPDGGEFVLGGCGPLETDAYDEPREPQNWRWTTMAFALDPARPAGGRTGPLLRAERPLAYETVAEGHFTTDLWASWLLRDRDAPRWAASFTEPIASGPLANLPGVFWTHTPGPVGGGEPTEWERARASHFDSGRAQISTEPPIPARAPYPCIVPITPLIARGVFGPLPTPWIGFSTLDCPIVLPDLRAILRVGPDVFEPQPGFDPAWLAEFAVPDVRWVAAAETDGWLPEEDVRYAGLGTSDLALSSLLVERDGDLVDVIEQQPCAPGQCDPLPFPQALRSVAPDTDGRVLVLSARRRTLWSIEREGASGERRRVHALSLDARRWYGLDEGGAPMGRVLAATYAAPDDALYVLDDVPVRPGRARARLLRIDVGIGRTDGTVIAEWPRASTNDRFAMAVDPGGALYLAGTQAGGRLSVVARLERGRRGSFEPTGFVVRGARFVPEGLRANERGLTLVLDDAAEGALPVAIGFDELRPGRGGIVRCL